MIVGSGGTMALYGLTLYRSRCGPLAFGLNAHSVPLSVTPSACTHKPAREAASASCSQLVLLPGTTSIFSNKPCPPASDPVLTMDVTIAERPVPRNRFI